MVKRILVVLLCLVFLTAHPFEMSFGAQKLTAEMTELSGSVQVIRGGGEKAFKAFKNMKLTEGDRVITGAKSWAKIRIDKDTTISLTENTKINISELKGSKGAKQSSIKLQAGGVGAFIKKLIKGGSRFEIKTPTAVMGVRGTEFFTGYSNGQTDVRVLGGTVEIGGQTRGRGRARVNAMEQVAFGQGESAGQIQEAVEPFGLDGLPLSFLGEIQDMNDENPGSVPDGVMDGMDEAMENAGRRSDENENRNDYAPDALGVGAGAAIGGSRVEGRPDTTNPPPRPRPPAPSQQQVEPVEIEFEVVDDQTTGSSGKAVWVTLSTPTEDAEILYRTKGEAVDYIVDGYDMSGEFMAGLLGASATPGNTQSEWTEWKTYEHESIHIDLSEIEEDITVGAYAKKAGMKDSDETSLVIPYGVGDIGVEYWRGGEYYASIEGEILDLSNESQSSEIDEIKLQISGEVDFVVSAHYYGENPIKITKNNREVTLKPSGDDFPGSFWIKIKLTTGQVRWIQIQVVDPEH